MVRRAKILIYLLVVFFVSLETQAKNPPPGTGTSDIPANILIMLDNSGSMRAALSSANSLHYPEDVAVDSNGNIYILESSYRRIKKFDSDLNYIKSFGGSGTGCNKWSYAYEIDIYDDKLYIHDAIQSTWSNIRQVKELTLDGQCTGKNFAYAPKFGGRTGFTTGITASQDYVFVTVNKWGYMGVTVYNRHSGGYIGFYSQGNFGNNNYFYQNQGMDVNDAGTKLLVTSWGSVTEFNIGSGGSLTFNCRATDSSYSTWGTTQRYAKDAIYGSGTTVFSASWNFGRVNKYSDLTNVNSCRYNFGTNSSNLTKTYGSPNYRNGKCCYLPSGLGKDSSGNVYMTDLYNGTMYKFDSDLNKLDTIGGAAGTRISVAKKVIKKIVSNTTLTSGANFGLMEWSTTRASDTRIRVDISDKGAKLIYTNVDGVQANGYTTDLRHAMNTARNYFTSGKVSNWKQKCVQNYLIVISDGYWSYHSQVLGIANQLNNAHNIKTFAVGFALSGPNNNYKQLAQSGGTKTPLYASNEKELIQKLTDAIKQAISGRLTFTTPAVMSDVTRGNFVYQSTFEYEKNKQWRGFISKYALNSDGSFGAEQWGSDTKSAAKGFIGRSASSRKLWTASIGKTGDYNNFTTANRDILKHRIFTSGASPTDTEVDNLINFVRGIDTYDEDEDKNTTEERHKLADVYHSDLIIVGKPEGSTAATGFTNHNQTDSYYRYNNQYDNFKVSNDCGGSCSSRKEVLYAGANSGFLHAVDVSNGTELWAYVPPNILQNLESIISNTANVTNAIYGVDSSPVVKDIYFDDTPNDGINKKRWRTVLLSGLGAGGKGFFALDVTDPDKPKHLFAVDHNETDKIITHWAHDESYTSEGYSGGSISSEMDFRKLGETWSVPRIIRMKVAGVEKWVAVFGAGYNGMSNPDIGSAVFVIDLENEGKVIKVIDIEDTAAQSYGWTGRLFKRVGGVLVDGNKKFIYQGNACYDPSKGESFTAEFTPTVGFTLNFKTGSGNNICIDYVDFDEAWPNTRNGGPPKPDYGNYFFRRMSNDIVNSLPANLTVITADSTDKANYNGAIVYATDLEGKLTKINLTDKGTLYDTTTLFNAEATSDNGRYIFTRPEVTIDTDQNLWLYFGTGNTQKMQEQSNKVQNRLFGIKDKDFPDFVQVNPEGDISQCKTAPVCPSNTDLGWYVNLKNSQKLTAEPTIDKDRVYFPIYEPTTAINACKSGKAILHAYNSKCGNSLLNINLGTGILSKVVVQGDNLYIGLAGEANTNIKGFTAKDNLITGKSDAQSNTKEVQLEAWKESY